MVCKNARFANVRHLIIDGDSHACAVCCSLMHNRSLFMRSSHAQCVRCCVHLDEFAYVPIPQRGCGLIHVHNTIRYMWRSILVYCSCVVNHERKCTRLSSSKDKCGRKSLGMRVHCMQWSFIHFPTVITIVPMAIYASCHRCMVYITSTKTM